MKEVTLVELKEGETPPAQADVVEISRTPTGKWVGEFVAGRCEHTHVVHDMFATYPQIMGRMGEEAAHYGVWTLYCRKRR